jgi:cell wall-associated NlpC family hydrolase
MRRLVACVAAVGLLLAPLASRVSAEPAPANVHVVQPGETLSGIADSVGVDSAALARLNGFSDANVLVVGQSVQLPASSPPPASPAAAPAAAAPSVVAPPAGAGAGAGATAGGRGYTVVDGDTLGGIARQLGTTTAALIDANTLDDPDHVRVGTQLALPPGASLPPSSGVTAAANVPAPNAAPAAAPASVSPSGPPAAAAPPASPSPSGPAAGAAGPAASGASAAVVGRRSLLVSYTVQTGETLNAIARRFDVKPEAVIQASGLDDANKLSVGTVLKVPLPGVEHVVQAGETLNDIAAQEKVDLGSLVDFNAIDDPSLIRVGQVVLVPVAPTLQAATAPKPAPAVPQAAAPAPAAAAAAGSPPPAAPPAAPTPAPAAASKPAAPPTPPPGPPAAAKPAAPPAPRAAVPAPAGAPSDGLAGTGLKLLGLPYIWGGSTPSGFDCSGFVWYVARQAGKQISRGMLGEYNAGSHPSRDELEPGDLVFFQNTYSAGLSHNGIYIGNGQFVHAADEQAGVTVSSLGSAYWSGHWFGATRLA